MFASSKSTDELISDLRPTVHVSANKIQYGIHSMQGMRNEMEDAHAAQLGVGGLGDDAFFFGVYDGHGGKQCADFVEKHLLTNIVDNDAFRAGRYEEALKEGFSKTETDFIECAKQHELSDGTTAVAVLKINNTLLCANIGDSEAVVCRNGTASALTTVHNPSKNQNEEKRIIEAGGRTVHHRLGHPSLNPSIFSIAVSRSFGDIMFKDPKFTRGRPSGLIAEPAVSTTELTDRDEFVILACDGVWDVLSHQAAVDFVRERLRKSRDVETITRELCEAAYNKGSTDNITAIVVLLR